MFQPPRCPNRRCRAHRAPTPGFCASHGSYAAKCRPRPIPRFRCKHCGRTFSRQTFRADYRDHRPSLNAHLYLLLASGVGLRQSSRNLGLSRRCTELKARKLGRHLRRLHVNLCAQLPTGTRLQLDELETYETRRNTRPLTVPVLIEADSRFVIWAESAPIRPRGKMTEARRRAIEEEERDSRPRKDLSRWSLRRTLERGAALFAPGSAVFMDTDEKKAYPRLLSQAFRGIAVMHRTTHSKRERTEWNPLFPINQTEAIARDLTGRLRRDSWLVSKKRRWLDVALHVFITYRNYVRRRFNGDSLSPAVKLRLAPRRMTPGELLSWRQEDGERSIHPLSRGGELVCDVRRRRLGAA
jgi:transposase-like protein